MITCTAILFFVLKLTQIKFWMECKRQYDLHQGISIRAMHERHRHLRRCLFATTYQLFKDSNRIKSTISLLICNSYYIVPAHSYDSIYVYVSANIKMHKSKISRTMKHLQHLHCLHFTPYHFTSAWLCSGCLVYA